jgi:hypothetical protein
MILGLQILRFLFTQLTKDLCKISQRGIIESLNL